MRRTLGSSIWSVIAVVVAGTVLPGAVGAPSVDAAQPPGTVVAGVPDPTNVAQLVNLTNRLGSDSSGNAYLATPDRIWKVDASTGALTAIVGTGEVGHSADGTLATSARITEPEAITVDTDGTVYFYENYRIRKVTPGGTITTVAGTGLSGWGTAGLLANGQPMLDTASIAIDSSHNVYFSQASAAHVGVRMINASTGLLSTVVSGNGAATSTCLGENGPALSLVLRNVGFQIAIDASNNLYLAPACDLSNHSHVLRVSGGTSTLVAGGGGATPSPGVNALTVVLPYITDFAASATDLYAVGAGYSQIWRMTIAGNLMYPVAGASGCGAMIDGQQATWLCTNQMAFGPGPAIWITNWGQFGKLSNGTFDLLTPAPHPADGVPATSVGLSGLGDLAVRGDGELYYAEGTTGYLRTVTTAGLLATKGGNGDVASAPVFGGAATASSLGYTQLSLDTDAAGSLYFIFNDSYVAKITTAGTLVKVAGTGQFVSGPDGPAATTNIAPRAIAAAPDGTVYLLEYHYVACGMSMCSVGLELRHVDLAGNITTLWTSPASTWPYVDLTVAPDGSVVLLGDTGGLARWTPSTGLITALPLGPATGATSVHVDDHGDIYIVVPGAVLKVGPAGAVLGTVYTHASWGNAMTLDIDAVGGVYVGHDGAVRKIPQAPGAPTDLAVSRSGSSATLSWTPPVWTGGNTPRYRIQMSTDGGATWSGIAGVSQTTFTLDWLVDGTSYLFRVDALNDAGFGGTTPAVAPVEVPAAPDLDLLPPGLEVSDSTPTPSQTVTIDAAGFQPNEWVAVVLQSTPTLIANVRADASGVVHATVTMPAGTVAGEHTLSLVGDTSGNGYQADLTVVTVDDGLARPTPPPATFTAVTPARLFETRPTEPQGAITVTQQRYGGDAKVLKVKVTGVAGVPSSGVAAVSLNVTAVFPVADGFVTVYPCGGRPLVASLNYEAGEIVPNAVIAPVSADGEICLYSMVDTYLVADVNGWFATGAGFNAVQPKRLVETRPAEAQGAITVVQQRYGGDNVLKVRVVDVAGVPASGVAAVSLNVTAVSPVGDGFVTVYPCGTRPLTASVNYRAGEIVPNAVIAPVSASGEICLYSMVDTYLIADVNGWFATGSGFETVTPTRLFETRPTDPQGAITVSQQRYGGDAKVLKVKVTGVAGVPSSGVGAVSLNVTAVYPVADGFVTVYPCGTRPLAANVNYVAGEIVPNAVIAPVSASGEICLYSMADTYLVADVNGWFATSG